MESSPQSMINEMKISSRGPQIIVQFEEKLCVGVRLSGVYYETESSCLKPPDVCWWLPMVCEVTGSYPESYAGPGALNFTLLSSARPGLNTPE